ncbi:ATP-binding protein [Thermococcus radiotolerans]|uniref:Carbon monoxide dehydrogenase n=1 Tax=Thermococcus radiotolerans TaxID=187880 RepID=A0A2Z2NBE7_9EURY|nr:AAA family ATPase [Thermococcus radiotolerans]ASJ15006.1 carbon monoxide dehydrogenase [Thermococcus radiotolerans]
MTKPPNPADEERRKKLFEIADELRERTKKQTPEEGFRVVITGKGGVGKTTMTAILARLLARDGYRVLAVDEDPQMNLAHALGVPKEVRDKIVPLNRNLDYIEEKTGARPGTNWGLYFSLTPDVRDVVDRFGVVGPDGVMLLVMGSVVQAAAGCLCPENALLDAVIKYINLRKGEIILMDTQAGLEHFGRALARGFKQAVILTEPTYNSVQVAVDAAKLARQLGIEHVHLVINKVKKEGHVEKVERILNELGFNDFTTKTVIPYDEMVEEYDPEIEAILANPESPTYIKALELKNILLKYAE